MVSLGYAMSSEEHGPDDLVENASRAERTGFEFAMLSDHYHPWTSKQGESPFVWSTLGGIARETDALEVATGVTCPIRRIHPAVIAQAAATAGTMFEGRFSLGVGTGENLNEHVVGERWPPHHVRLRMLDEAVRIVRELWDGEMHSHDGEFFTVEDAQVFTRPEEPPDVLVAAGGTDAASFAGEAGDGLVSTAPDEAVIRAFEDGGGGEGDRPKYGQITVCYADSEDEARRVAHEWWPNAALPGELGQVLPTPTHFEQAVEMVSEADVAERVVCGPDPEAHVSKLREFADAGFDHVYVHQVGPDQDGFFEFYESEVLPAFD